MEEVAVTEFSTIFACLWIFNLRRGKPLIRVSRSSRQVQCRLGEHVSTSWLSSFVFLRGALVYRERWRVPSPVTILLVAAAKYGLKNTDEEGYAFVLSHLLRSNENTLFFFLLLKYSVMRLKPRILITLIFYYIIFDPNIST